MVYSYGQHTVSIELPQSMTSLSCAPVPLPGVSSSYLYNSVCVWGGGGGGGMAIQ